MEFGEILAMLIVFVGAPWAVFTGIAKVKATNAAKTVSSGSGLRMSELKAMVEDAVADATGPLRARIESLEAIVTEDEDATRRLDAALLADLEGDGDGDELANQRRRVRS
ncbi:MAG: hypothetical protein Rubg2KO_19870 [Rubricoccaceae bacterium]